MTQFDEIRAISESQEDSQKSLDLYMGYSGFDTLEAFGYVCRIRNTVSKTLLECKKRVDEITWIEQEIKLNSINDGYNFLSLLGMKPYLYISKEREVRKTKDLLLCLDVVEYLGCFIEIEFLRPQDSQNDFYLESFIKQIGIQGNPAELYGDILKHKLFFEDGFKKEFESKLSEIIG